MKYTSNIETDTATSKKDKTSFLLSQLRCAALRVRLVAAEIDSIGVALRGGLIDANTAVAWLRDYDLLEYVTSPQGAAL